MQCTPSCAVLVFSALCVHHAIAIDPGAPDPFPALDAAHSGQGVFYPPGDLDSFLPPAAGESFIDPVFNTEILRLSDAKNTADNARGGHLPLVTHEYATISPFNADNSRLLLQHFSYFALYDRNGQYLQDLPFEVTASSEPRWLRSDPAVFQFISGNELRRYDTRNGDSTVLKTFDQYSRISGLGESDLSRDDEHRVLVGDNREIFVYSLATDSMSPVLSTAGTGGVDNVFITPDNNVLVGWYQPGNGRFNGVEMFDSNMNFLKQVTSALGHMDVARDSDGEEILLWTNSGDREASADCRNGVVKIRLSDLRRTCLLSLEWGIAVHISAAEAGDWFVVSTYTPDDQPGSAPPQQGFRYQNEILRVRLDGGAVQRLAHHRSRRHDGYAYQPKATLSRDGRFIVYASNNDLQTRLGHTDVYTDAYLIDASSCSSMVNGPDGDGSWYREGESGLYVYRVQEYNDAIDYHGEWTAFADPGLSGGSILASGNAGDRLDYRFQGSAVSWISFTGPWSGMARVLINGEERAVIDTFSEAATVRDRVYTVTDMPPGEHLLQIEVMPQQDGRRVWIDAVDSLPSRLSGECLADEVSGSVPRNPVPPQRADDLPRVDIEVDYCPDCRLR